MEMRELGRSGIAVSRVILGCGNFGGVGSSPAFFGQGIPKEEAFRIMDAGWELGLVTFDTADAYGPGVSEELIAEALFPYDGLLIATKGGYERTGPSGESATGELIGWTPNGRPGHLRSACEASLRRLRLDRIDLYQLHTPDPSVPYAESIGAVTAGSAWRGLEVGARRGGRQCCAPTASRSLASSRLTGRARLARPSRATHLLCRADRPGPVVATTVTGQQERREGKDSPRRA